MRVSNLTVAGYLADMFGWSPEKSARVASIAAVYGTNAVPTDNGYVDITYLDGTSSFLISDHSRRICDVHLPGDEPGIRQPPAG